MSDQNDVPTGSSIPLHRRTFLGGIGVLLSGILLAACSRTTCVQDTVSPPPLPTASSFPIASSGSAVSQTPASPTPTTSGATASASVNTPSIGPLPSPLPPTPTLGASPTGTFPTITLADNGTTVKLAIGSQVFLALSTDDDWTITVENGTSLTPYVSEPLPPRLQAGYRASQPGQTTISAVGEPVCRKAQPPCGAPTVLFRVQVVVM